VYWWGKWFGIIFREFLNLDSSNLPIELVIKAGDAIAKGFISLCTELNAQ